MHHPDHDAYRAFARERAVALRTAAGAPVPRPTPLRARLGTLLVAQGERLAPTSRRDAPLPDPSPGRCA